MLLGNRLAVGREATHTMDWVMGIGGGGACPIIVEGGAGVKNTYKLAVAMERRGEEDALRGLTASKDTGRRKRPCRRGIEMESGPVGSGRKREAVKKGLGAGEEEGKSGTEGARGKKRSGESGGELSYQ